MEEVKCLTNLSALPIDLALDYNRFVTVNMDCTFQSYTLKVISFKNLQHIKGCSKPMNHLSTGKQRMVRIIGRKPNGYISNAPASFRVNVRNRM